MEQQNEGMQMKPETIFGMTLFILITAGILYALIKGKAVNK